MQNVAGQIAKEFAFDDQSSVNIQVIRLENEGQKICVINRTDSISYECVIYNLDYSVFKTISIDLDPLINVAGLYSPSLVFNYVSENTFDLDNDIDVLCQLTYYDGNDDLYAQVVVFHQNGSVLFASDIGNSNAYLINSSIANGALLPSLVNTDIGTKMILDVYYFNEGRYSFDVYSLPGSVASGLKNAGATAEQENSLMTYPVPANDELNMEYKLAGNEHSGDIEVVDQQGRTVQTIHLDQNQGNLKMPLRNYAGGLYFYKLNSKRGAPRTAKVLIVR